MYKKYKNVETKTGDHMNFYKKSKKEFKRCIRENPYLNREEWDRYAQKNCLASSVTLEAHELTDETIEILNKQNKDRFEFLKELFIIIPSKELRFFNKIIRVNTEKREKQKE